MCKGLMIYFQLSTTFRYKSLKNSNYLRWKKVMGIFYFIAARSLPAFG